MSLNLHGLVVTTTLKKVKSSGPTAVTFKLKELTPGGMKEIQTTGTVKTVWPSLTMDGHGTICLAKIWDNLSANGMECLATSKMKLTPLSNLETSSYQVQPT
jgi:hypothetical protein